MPKRRSTRRGAQPPPDRGSYTPNAGLHFDDVEFEQRLVWIWTMARSGSTWFLRTLTHPMRLQDSGKDPEDMLGFSAPPTWQGTVDAIPVDTTFLANHLLPLTSGPHYLPNGSAATFGAALGLPPKANYFFSAKYRDVWLPELRRMMLVRFHALAERTAERYETESPLIFIKEVAGAHAAPLIMSMFPRSKMIFLVRDGRDVVDSQTAANKPGGWMPVSGWKTPEDRLDFVVQRGRDWVGDVGSIQRAYEHHPDELRRMVRYEDLLAEGAGKIGPLIEWLGLNRNALWLQRTIEKNDFGAIAPEHKGEDKFYRSATPGAWRKNLTPEEGDALEAELAPTLAELGYDVGGGEGAGKRPPPRPEPPVAEEPAEAPPAEPEQAPQSSPFSGTGGGDANVLSASLRNRSEGRDVRGVPKLVKRRGSVDARRRRRIALTFDDGPVLQTEEVLQTLESRGARGTFFLVGRKVPGHEPMVRRIAAGGHEIGNHSFGHPPYPERDDVMAGCAVLEQVSGHRPRLFRPPFGVVDRPSAEGAIAKGMDVIMWSVDSDDGNPPWEGIPAPEIVDNVIGRIHPGAIVLMHDGLPWSHAVEALPEIVDRLQAEGFELVTVSELLDEGEEAPARRSALRRLTGRLGGSPEARSGSRTNGSEAGPPTEAIDSAAAAVPELLARLSESIELPPADDLEGRLLALARDEMATDEVARSPAFLRQVAAEENNVVRMIALGFALRIAERAEYEAADLDAAAVSSLRDADDPVAAAARLARELASPTRVQVLVKQRLAEAGGPDPAIQAGPRLTALFTPGADAWQELQDRATAAGRAAARTRMEAILADADADPEFDLEAVVDRLDVEFSFRYGYALAACEAAQSPART